MPVSLYKREMKKKRNDKIFQVSFHFHESFSTDS